MTLVLLPRWAVAPGARPGLTSGAAARADEDGERGAATPLTLVLGVALIVLPVLVLILTVPIWEERTVDAQDAARAAARAVVIAANEPSGIAAANQAVDEVFYGDGIPADEVAVAYSGEDLPGGSVTVTVTVVIPAGEVPGLGSIGQLHYTASSTEHVDSYEDSTT